MNQTIELYPGQCHEGFRLDSVTPLPNLRAVAYRLEHVKSGARVLHVHAEEDTENCFAITFPTPPPDDTGLPHILEHAVLGGSKRFPVKEPFFEMAKMSLATFINAMTSQAYTVYPIASNVRKDFFNLAEVYVDAVFHPELKEATFHREGHHFTLADNADLTSPLRVTGIVYSEMKGAYSTPESLAYRWSNRGLFPDTLLGRDSGGDPDHIPELTYEQFRRFYETHYHPNNALLFIYGDIPTLDHLRFLAPILDQFDRQEVCIPTPRQPRWPSPRRLERGYPIGPTDDVSERTFMTLNWLVADATDPARVTDWWTLSQLLLGNEAAPLKKALIDSKLGADVFMTGASSLAYENTFHVGLKGSEPSRVDPFEELVLGTLQELVAQDISQDRVEAAFQELAYLHLEVSTLFPLKLLHFTNLVWPYGGDPLLFLRMNEHLDVCRKRYEANPRMFNHMIEEELLNNSHRLLVALRPDREVQARADAEFEKRMAEERGKLTAEQVATLAREAAELEAAQSVPNPPEALATLPQLAVSDLPRKLRHIPTEIGRVGGIEVLRNDVFANGVNYVEIDIDLAGLPVELYAFLPRFNDAVAKMGAAGQGFEEVARRRSACTGGVGSYARVCRHAADPGRSLFRLRFSLRTLDDKVGDALQLLGDLMFGVDPCDSERLRNVMTQTRAWYRTTLVNDGLSTARRQAARGLSPEAALDHLFLSPEALRLVDDLTLNLSANAERLMESIERIRDFAPSRRRWTVSFTGSASAFTALTRTLEEWSSRLPEDSVVDAPPPFAPYVTPPREGLACPLNIAHCAKVMPAPHLSQPGAPLFNVGLYLGRFDYLLPEIRFRGNAYGAGVAYDDMMGTFYLFSFRDPHIVETLAVFDGLRHFVHGAPWTQTEVDRAIIGLAKEAERPIRPGEATSTALTRHLRGDTNELREQRYEATLRATPQEVKRVLIEQLEDSEPKAAVCVVASREKLEEANRTLGQEALRVEDILRSE